MQINSGTLEMQGATILYYETHGDASSVPLFVLHGGPGFDHTYFLASPVWDELATNRQVVFYDQRGTGQSSPLEPDGSCTLADQLADLEALREHLGHDRIDVLGHSWGGYLGMAYAVRHAHWVRRLVLVDSCTPRPQDFAWRFAEFYPETWERWQALEAVAQLGDRSASLGVMSLYVSMLCCSPGDRDACQSAVDPAVFREEVYRKLWSDAEQYDLTPVLSQFAHPTLVVTGRFDINVPPVTGYGIHKVIPNSRFVVFESSGHLPFFEEPEAFGQVVEEFLSGA